MNIILLNMQAMMMLVFATMLGGVQSETIGWTPDIKANIKTWPLFGSVSSYVHGENISNTYADEGHVGYPAGSDGFTYRGSLKYRSSVPPYPWVYSTPIYYNVKWQQWKDATGQQRCFQDFKITNDPHVLTKDHINCVKDFCERINRCDTLDDYQFCAEIGTDDQGELYYLGSDVAADYVTTSGPYPPKCEVQNIVELSFRSMYIVDIDADAFHDGGERKFSGLKNLILKGNRFSKLKNNTIRGVDFPQLETLVLSSNKNLISLDDNTMDSSTLTDLQLDYMAQLETISKNALFGFPNLKWLTLTGSWLPQLPAEMFRQNPLMEKIWFSYNKYMNTSLPYDVFQGLTKLTHLYMNNNNFSSLPDGLSRNLASMTLLHIGWNKLKVLGDEVYWGAHVLDRLYMNDNLLPLLPQPLFKDQGLLDWLDAKRCCTLAINSIPDTIFHPLVNTTYMWFNGNDLHTVHVQAFANMISLRVLYMQDNDLTIMPDYTTNTLLLKELYLSRNKIPVVPSDFIKDLRGLEKLYLDSNLITNLDSNHFGNAWRLLYLELSSNLVLKIPSDGFCQNCPKLKLLGLNNNSFSKLPNLALEFNTDLKELYLQDNVPKMKRIDPRAFAGQLFDFTTLSVDRVTLCSTPSTGTGNDCSVQGVTAAHGWYSKMFFKYGCSYKLAANDDIYRLYDQDSMCIKASKKMNYQYWDFTALANCDDAHSDEERNGDFSVVDGDFQYNDKGNGKLYNWPCICESDG